MPGVEHPRPSAAEVQHFAEECSQQSDVNLTNLAGSV
jgi:hypothetical protein